MAYSAFDHLSGIEPELANVLAARVDDGCMLLDETEPGWWRRIESDRLAMDTCDRCVLSQLHGDFRAGLKAVLKPEAGRTWLMAVDLGFTLDPAEQVGTATLNDDEAIGRRITERFAALADLWRMAVEARSRNIGGGGQCLNPGP